MLAGTHSAWAWESDPLQGIDLRREQQWQLVRELLPLYGEFCGESDRLRWQRYSPLNSWFVGADAVFHELLLRFHPPERVIEIGSGFSSALLLDVNDEWNLGVDFTFIDPDLGRLRALMSEGVESSRVTLSSPVTLIEQRQQDVDPAILARLSAGDMLLIDSSHVYAPRTDVKDLLDHVLPGLSPGVLVYFHDIFYPFTYPHSWLESRPDINETWAVADLLRHQDRYVVHLWNDYLQHDDPDWFAEHMPACCDPAFPTGGLWLEVA